ncbi:N utilization substance protein B [Bacteroidia bacterium]|nr:N utilization substance protein B [Bacteroidia bacterium]
MLSRRFIRIKVLKTLYGYLNAGGGPADLATKELMFSLHKTYELYGYFLVLPIALADYAAQQIALGKQKQRPCEEEKNPNTKFADNTFVQLLRDTAPLQAWAQQEKMLWSKDVLKKLYHKILSTPYYQQYMARAERSLSEDKLLITKILEYSIEDNEDIYAWIEEQSIYWVDDIEYCLSHAIRTLKSFVSHGKNELLPDYKDKDDKEFVERLFSNAVVNYKEYRDLVDKHAKNWDVERVAFMDIVAMVAAIAEITTFANIPIKVSLNEYIEIIKYYSTPNSCNFINGVLDKIVADLQSQHKIEKTGRGLVDMQ